MEIEDLNQILEFKGKEHKYVKVKNDEKHDISILDNEEINNLTIIFEDNCEFENYDNVNLIFNNSIISNLSLNGNYRINCKNVIIKDSNLINCNFIHSDNLYLFNSYLSEIKLYESSKANIKNCKISCQDGDICLNIFKSNYFEIEKSNIVSDKNRHALGIKILNSKGDIYNNNFKSNFISSFFSELYLGKCEIEVDSMGIVSNCSKLAIEDNNLDESTVDKLKEENKVEKISTRQVFVLDKI